MSTKNPLDLLKIIRDDDPERWTKTCAIFQVAEAELGDEVVHDTAREMLMEMYPEKLVDAEMNAPWEFGQMSPGILESYNNVIESKDFDPEFIHRAIDAFDVASFVSSDRSKKDSRYTFAIHCESKPEEKDQYVYMINFNADNTAEINCFERDNGYHCGARIQEEGVEVNKNIDSRQIKLLIEQVVEVLGFNLSEMDTEVVDDLMA
jgi:hypothetical protein